MSDFENDQLQDRDFERYGVWVKAGPEDVVETDEDFGFEDLDSSLVTDELLEPPSDDASAEDELSTAELDVDFDLDDDVMTIDDLGIEEPEVEPDPFTSLADDGDDAEGDYVTAMPGVEDSDELSDIEFDSVPDMESEELPELESEALVVEHEFTPDDQGIDIDSEPVNMLTTDEEQFLDEEDPSIIDDFRDDLQISPDRAIPSEMDQQEQAAFQRIQDELTAIKSELAMLRQQLSGRPAASSIPADPLPKPESAPDDDILGDDILAGDEFDIDDAPAMDEVFSEPDGQTDATEAAAHGPGFFEEDEDETIALTGDELDNILNTAEFVEETGEAAVIDDDFPLSADQPYEPSAIIEGDEQHVDHLAEMDIDKELAGIDELSDETIEPAFEDSALEEPDDLDAGFDDFAAAVEGELQTEGVERSDDELVDELVISDLDDDLVLEESGLELEIEDETAFETPAEEDELVLEDQMDEIELGDVDELEINDLDLDDVAIDEPQIDEPLDEPLDEQFEIDEPETVEEATADSDAEPQRASLADLPDELKAEIRSILSYMDHLLEALPDEKIQEFAQSEHFEVYKRLFEELGLEN